MPVDPDLDLAELNQCGSFLTVLQIRDILVTDPSCLFLSLFWIRIQLFNALFLFGSGQIHTHFYYHNEENFVNIQLINFSFLITDRKFKRF